jgi:benzoyl-CoA reductase subunit D
MVTAGIDCGAKNTKVVLLKDNEVVSKGLVLSGFDQKASVEEAFSEALDKAGFSKDDVECVIVTGEGKKEVSFADTAVTEVKADARGATFFFPSARTVIDVGAEEGRAIKCDEKGKVVDFAINEKCAAGAGTFTETMARALEVDVDKIGELSLKSKKAVPMNAQCTVFAESEVVSLIHAKVPKEDIARAVHDAISDRITSMVRRVGIEKDIVLVGGVANNIGFVDSLKRDLETDIMIPEDPAFISAFGAALIGADGLKK